MSDAEEVEVKDVKKPKAKVAEPPMEPMTIKVDGALKEQLQAVADQDGKSTSEVSREILEKALSNTPDRQRAALLRSLRITRAQLEAMAKGTFWFKYRPLKTVLRDIRDLEEYLQEP